MPITRRNYTSVYFDGRTRLQNNTPINNFNAQSTTKALLDVISVEMERLYDAGDYIYRAIDPTRAVGKDLDNLGFLVGEKRNESVTAADYSNTNFHFYIDKKLNWSIDQLLNKFYSAEELDQLKQAGYLTLTPSMNYNLIIPKGTIVQNIDGTITYSLISDANLEGTKPAYVGIIATGAGPSKNVGSNVLVDHLIFQIPELRKIARYIKCTNTFPIQNGAYSQSDDQLRYRISTKGSAYQGNELSIRRAVLQVPGVRDILYEKNKFGAGTSHIIVDAVSPLASEGLIAAVQEAAQAVSSYGDIVFVSRPKYLGVELNFSIIVEPGTPDPLSVRNQARDLIIQYINDLPIGGEIVWNRIVSIVLDIQSVEDFIPNYFKYGTYDIYNKINKEQVVLRFINQKARYSEKFYTDSGLITCCVA